MEETTRTAPPEESKLKKYWWLLLLLLLLLLSGFWWLGRGKKAPEAATEKQAPGQAVKKEIDLADQETRELRLNFKGRYLLFTGYPYVDVKYRPRLYNLIYADTIFAPDDMANLTDPSGKWENIYEMSTAEPKIYMPLVRSAGGPMIWQTMEILDKSAVAGVLGDCSGSDYKLTGDLAGVSYTCPQTAANKESAGSAPCFLPVEGEKGILYRQFSSDGSAVGNMCEVLKNNYLFSVAFKPF